MQLVEWEWTGLALLLQGLLLLLLLLMQVWCEPVACLVMQPDGTAVVALLRPHQRMWLALVQRMRPGSDACTFSVAA
jgi:hypothetical protein